MIVDLKKIISYHVNQSGYQGISFSDLRLVANVPAKQLDKILQNLLSQKTIIQADRENRIYIHKNIFEKLKADTLNYLENYHKTHPLKAGMPKEELKTKFPSILASKLFNLTINQMIEDGDIAHEENSVRLATHTVSLGQDQADVRNKILDSYSQAGLQPPYFKELSKSLEVESKRAKEVLMHLVEEGLIVKAKEELYFHTAAIEGLKKKLVEFLDGHGEITTPQFKKMTGASRKYVIPLAEYFDAKNVTLRVGDVRKLRKG